MVPKAYSHIHILLEKTSSTLDIRLDHSFMNFEKMNPFMYIFSITITYGDGRDDHAPRTCKIAVKRVLPADLPARDQLIKMASS